MYVMLPRRDMAARRLHAHLRPRAGGGVGMCDF